jgi:hypothetical protein
MEMCPLGMYLLYLLLTVLSLFSFLHSFHLETEKAIRGNIPFLVWQIQIRYLKTFYTTWTKKPFFVFGYVIHHKGKYDKWQI